MEWNKKLLETNQLVMELLNTYPELASYISSENGLLKIDDTGFEVVKNKLEREQNLALLNNSTDEITKSKSQWTIDKKDWKSDFDLLGTSYAQVDFDKMLELYNTRSDLF
jgi:hypothetical protein